MIWNHYHIAESIEDALAALRGAQGPACPLGGGTDLLLEIQQGHRPAVDTLVDLTRIPELVRLEIQEGRLFIGAGAPVSRIAEDGLVCAHAPAVAEACALIGGPQVRNSATLGGNVAHALPAADGMIALVAMDAEAEIASESGRRRAPLLSLFRGPGQTSLDLSREFLVGFHLNLRQPGEGCAFSRVMRPQGVALPILNMAAWLRREGERIAGIHIAVGPAGPTPQRAGPVEEFLCGCIYTPANIEAAVEIWHTSMRFRTSPQRASAEYRYHLSGVLYQEVISRAWQRSFESASV
jgi:xanthine dehydrogenase FAD-binding subunit